MERKSYDFDPGDRDTWPEDNNAAGQNEDPEITVSPANMVPGDAETPATEEGEGEING